MLELKNVKVQMDEQTKQSLDMLKGDFEEILRPMAKLNELFEKVKILSESEEETADEFRGTLRAISSDIAKIKKNSDELLDGQNLIQTELTNFKQALESINWEEN